MFLPTFNSSLQKAVITSKKFFNSPLLRKISAPTLYQRSYSTLHSKKIFVIFQIQTLYRPPFNSSLQKTAVTLKKLSNSPLRNKISVVSQIQTLYLLPFFFSLQKTAIPSKKFFNSQLGFYRIPNSNLVLAALQIKRPPINQRSYSTLTLDFRVIQNSIFVLGALQLFPS